MPSLGLLLEHPIFESYSKRIATANEKLDPSHPDYRNPIDFDVHKAEIERFKEEHIYRRMRESEDKVEVYVHFSPSLNDSFYIDTNLLIIHSFHHSPIHLLSQPLLSSLLSLSPLLSSFIDSTAGFHSSIVTQGPISSISTPKETFHQKPSKPKVNDAQIRLGSVNGLTRRSLLPMQAPLPKRRKTSRKKQRLLKRMTLTRRRL